MIKLLQCGYRILNIDESWLNQTNFTRQIWCPPQTPATVTQRPISQRISLIAAIDTDGKVYYSLTQSNTDQNVMLVFLTHLVNVLDEESERWRSNTIILLDGARYHTGKDFCEYMRRLNLNVIWSGPYSFSAAPIETVFATLKFGELNTKNESTGKNVSSIL